VRGPHFSPLQEDSIKRIRAIQQFAISVGDVHLRMVVRLHAV
jgi:hypothetical protein